ncbi:MAG: efflux RND transporter periplasmic adaptor subunit [Clostridia bacterium]|nr:efflux RND transporter periplasmic adaptor subunit [Clostridia bacterium]
MKKYILLFCFTVLSVFLILIYSSAVRSNIPSVRTVVLVPTRVTDEVTASGIVQACSSRSIRLDMPVAVKDVEVGVGDRIEKGQTLFTVDREATYAMLSSAARLSGEAGGISQRYAEVFSQMTSGRPVAFTEIPENINADISGVLTELNVREGETALPGSPVCTLSDLTKLEALVSIDEKDVCSVEKGQSAVISGVGLGGRSYSGTVETVYPAAKIRLNGMSNETVVDAVISIDKEDEAIKPGFNVSAVISTGESRQEIIIPYECIRQDEDSVEYVYVYSMNSARRTDIVTSDELTSGVVAVSGVSAGDEIILDPDIVPSNGARVARRTAQKDMI